MREERSQGELYDVMLADVVRCVDRGRLAAALEESRRGVRFDMIQDVLRSAVLESTLCCYNSWPYVFTGRIYEQAARTWRVFDNLVYDCMRMCGVPDGHYSRVKGISAMLESATRCKVLEPDPCLMVFRNCVFDTETREREAFSPLRPAVTMVDYDYDPDDQPTRWLDFLNRVLPDRELQTVLQEYLGAIFIRRSKVKIEKMLILLGSGANGKSVIYETIRGILGENNVWLFPISSFLDKGERQKNLATVNGSRLNYASEMTMGDFKAKDSDLKSIISGERQAARFVGENPFMASEIPLLMANTNFIPTWTDSSKGFRRRFNVIPFSVEIPESEQDPRLTERLRGDYSGIFNWIMEGKLRLISNDYKFTHSEEMEDILDECQAQSSTVMRYMLSRKFRPFHPDRSLEGVEILASPLFADYVKWCLAERVPPAEQENKWTFGRIVKSAGYRSRETSKGIAYRIYCDRGEIPLPYMREKGDEGRRKEEVKADIRPWTDNAGRKWVRTRYGIARHLNVSESVISGLVKRGELKGATRKDPKDGKIICFDIEETRKVLQCHYAGKKMSEEEREEADRRNIKRNKFNVRMKELNLPYRKYDSKWDIYFQSNSDGLIRVPDDWVYEDEVPVEEQSPLIKRRSIKRRIDNFED